VPLLPLQLVQSPAGNVLSTGPHVCGSDRRVPLCTGLCPDLRSIALLAVAVCGPGLCAAVRADGFDGDAAILRSPLHDVRLGRPDVLPPAGFVLCPGFGLLC